MRTIPFLLSWLMMTSTASASSTDDQLRMFANCAGRLTAQLEHQWLLNDQDAQITEQQRLSVVALLDAAMPKNRGRDVLVWRTDARAAQRALLQRATFGTDIDKSAWAAQMATVYIADCTAFLLG